MKKVRVVTLAECVEAADELHALLKARVKYMGGSGKVNRDILDLVDQLWRYSNEYGPVC